MTPLGEAQRWILDRVAPLPAVEVPVGEALGLVAAGPVVSQETVSPFVASALDGYAVRAADTVGAPVELDVVGRVVAGAVPAASVGPGQAIRIMTGAMVPDGADAVVAVEQTASSSGAGDVVVIEAPVTVGAGVRGAGEDVRVGDVVLPPGATLRPARIGVLASVGVERVTVVPRPRVGVLSTGDELVTSGPLGRGQLRDSNRRMLLALVTEAGFEPVDMGIVGDDEAAVAEAIGWGLGACDAVLTSGGVSMGDLDHVKVVLGRLGEGRTMRVAIKPGKPLAAAVAGGVPVLGLPGNPVAALVSFELFARPALRKLAGHPDHDLHRPVVSAVALEPLRRRADGKVHLVRVVARPGEGGLVVRLAGSQGSHQLNATADANALAWLPDGDGVPGGGRVPVTMLGP